MKRELPEIEEFLTRNNFSDKNLRELSAAINSKYKNPAIKNEVISTISPYLRNFGIDFSSYFNSADKKTDGKQKRKRVLLKSKKRRKNKTISKASGNIKSPKAGNVRVKSLPQQFPEIDAFFERKSFSEDELNSLKDMVEQQYRNEQMRKAGLSLIALHLVKYKIESTQKPIPQASVKLKKPVEKKKIPKPKPTFESQNTSKPKKDVDQILLELKDMSITDISNRINIPRSVLFYELEKNGIEKRGNSKLTALEFGFISTLIRRRLGGDKIIGAKNKTGKAIKRYFGKGKKNYDGVFGKIQRYGGAGKVIYTRM